MSFLFHLFRPWCWRMAWRDSRRARGRLLVFSGSIMAGLAALVAIGSLRESVLRTLDDEARALLGADVYLHARRSFPERAQKLIADLPAEVQRETGFTVMARALETRQSRLVQARAVDKGFPFFGTPQTDPPAAWSQCLNGGGFVVAAALAEALQVNPGDEVQIGDLTQPLLGVLTKPPPAVSLVGAVVPEVFFARSLSARAGLDENALFTFHRVWLRFPDGYDVEKLVTDKLRRPLRSEGVSIESVAGRKRTAQRVLDIAAGFLSLTAFIALVLGGIGVASALQVHAMERLPSVATLRCLGCPAGRAMAVYVLQGIWLGIAGAAGGVLLGTLIVKAAPIVAEKWLPVTITTQVSGETVVMALGFGFLLCLSFALLPLLKVRRVPALAAVRAGVDNREHWWRDPLAWLVAAVVAGSLLWLAIRLSPERLPESGVFFTIALAAGLLLLAGVALAIMWIVRRLVRAWWPFTVRMGLSSLYRPRNQTLLFLTSVGLGTALILATVLTQSMLTRFLSSKAMAGKSNFFITEIKAGERTAMEEKLKSLGAASITSQPMAVMRIAQVNGQSPDELQKEPHPVRGWVFTHPFSATCTAEAAGPADAGPPGALEVSLDQDTSGHLKRKIDKLSTVTLTCGDQTLNAIVRAEAHERTPPWDDPLHTFPIIVHGPPGALESLPHSWFCTARVDGPVHGARVQREIAAAFPLAMVIDGAAVAGVIDDIIWKASLMVTGLCLLTVFAGAVIVAGVLLAGRRDRLYESVLLRTLGAERSQIRRIMLWEYTLLGLLAALTGALLAIGYAWLLAVRLFEIPFDTWLWPLAAAVGIVCALTIALGTFLSRGATSHPPLAILRGD